MRLVAFQSPNDAARTVLILKANPSADVLHPDAIYRVNIDNDGDYLTDIAFNYVFSKPQKQKQSAGGEFLEAGKKAEKHNHREIVEVRQRI